MVRDTCGCVSPTLHATCLLPINIEKCIAMLNAYSCAQLSHIFFHDAGSGKTLAFLLPVVAALHQQNYEQQQLQQQQEELAATDSSADKTAQMSAAQQTSKPSSKRSKASRSPSAQMHHMAAKGNTEGIAKGSLDATKGSAEAAKGPQAIILAPSRELAAQTARCLLLLLKGLKLRCTLLTAAVAAGTDFCKVASCSTFLQSASAA